MTEKTAAAEPEQKAQPKLYPVVTVPFGEVRWLPKAERDAAIAAGGREATEQDQAIGG